MKNLFTMTELMDHEPCEDGLTRLIEGLGTYSGPTIITIDDLDPLITSDILWCLKLLPISDHEQKLIAVKTALYAAELVAHLTDDPHAATCRAAVKAWLDNPCEETRNTAEAAAEAAWAASVEGGWAATAANWAARADPTTQPKIKAHLIQLIKELNE